MPPEYHEQILSREFNSKQSLMIPSYQQSIERKPINHKSDILSLDRPGGKQAPGDVHTLAIQSKRQSAYDAAQIFMSPLKSNYRPSMVSGKQPKIIAGKSTGTPSLSSGPQSL